MDNNWQGGVFWRQLLLEQAGIWYAAYTRSGPGRASHALYALL